MERRPFMVCLPILQALHVAFFGIHPLSCENVPRLRNGRFRRNLAYNRPRQYDLFEFEQHNRQFLFLDGKLYTGDNIRAGELGHVIIDPHSRRRCYCGQCGCFDAICNVAVLESCAGGSLSRFFEQLAAEEKDIKKVWNTYTNHLALAIHNLKMMLDCTIIIGGYLGAEIGPFIDDLYRKIDKLSVFTPYSKAYVYPCKYKREAKTIQHTIDGSCAAGLFPLVSIPTIVGCVGALLIIIAAIATPITKTQHAREIWFYVMSGGAVLKIVTMEIARSIL